jgi:hypothetical protein
MAINSLKTAMHGPSHTGQLSFKAANAVSSSTKRQLDIKSPLSEAKILTLR